MKVSSRMLGPKSRFNSVSAEPKLGIPCGLLASWTGLLTENSGPEPGVPGILQDHLLALSPIPHHKASAGSHRSRAVPLPETFTSQVCYLPLPVRLLGPDCLEQDLLSEGKYYCVFGHLFDPPESIFTEISTVSCSQWSCL